MTEPTDADKESLCYSAKELAEQLERLDAKRFSMLVYGYGSIQWRVTAEQIATTDNPEIE